MPARSLRRHSIPPARFSPDVNLPANMGKPKNKSKSAGKTKRVSVADNMTESDTQPIDDLCDSDTHSIENPSAGHSVEAPSTSGNVTGSSAQNVPEVTIPTVSKQQCASIL